MQDVLLTIVAIAAALFVIRRGIPGLFYWQGCRQQDSGEYEAAERFFLKALSFEKAVQRITGQKVGVALVCSNLGLLYHQQRRVDDAAKMFTTSIDIYSNIGRIDDSAPVYASLGKLYFDNGDLALAENALNEALAIYRRRLDAREAISSINQLLDAIAGRHCS